MDLEFFEKNIFSQNGMNMSVVEPFTTDYFACAKVDAQFSRDNEGIRVRTI